MAITIIPARGGSKRIPRKNVKDFFGKPMIAWSIEAAQKSGVFSKIIVSTDDPEIAEIALQYGAEVPFMRPESLSGDYVGTIPVIQHALEYYLKQGINYEFACCLYATAPFVLPEDLKQGFMSLKESQAAYCFSVTSYPFPIQRALKINAQKRVEMFDSSQFDKRSQDLEEAFHDAGQFYWGRANSWLSNRVIFSSDSIPLILPRARVQDIDTPEDWERAELLFKMLQQ